MAVTIIVSSEITCILSLLIVIYGIGIPNEKEKLKTRIFRVLVAAVIFSLFFDSLSYLIDGRKDIYALLLLVNLMAYGMTPIICSIFGYYVTAIINEGKKTTYKVAHVCAGLDGVTLLFIIVGAITGKMFTIENNTFVSGPWTEAICASNIVCIVVLYVFVLLNRDSVSIRALIAATSYLFAPILALALEVFDPTLSFTPSAYALSIQIIFVVLQAGEAEEARMRNEMLDEIASVDTLTGLNNRRVYQKRISAADLNKYYSVIFCDLNGLKETNDKLGHVIGDKFICRFAELLKKHFAIEDVYRISGDEFVIISTRYAESVFHNMLERFNREVVIIGEIASVGSAYGPGTELLGLISAAETEMYKNKEIYYQKSGHDRRKH